MSALNQKQETAKSTTPVRLSRRKKPRQSKKVPLILGATVVLLVGALAVQSFGVGLLPSSGDDESESYAIHDGVTSAPMVLDIPDASVPVDQIIDVAETQVDQAIEEAHASLDATVNEVHASVESSASVHAGLPALPPGYFPGMDVSSYVGVQNVAGHAIPVLDGHVDGLVNVAGSWSSMPSQIPDPQSLVPTDTQSILGGIDGVSELEGVISTVEETAGSSELSGVLGMLEGTLGDELPVPLPTGNPLDGSDPQSTAQPHEDGAQAAHAHAQALLGAADDVFGDLDAEASSAVERSEDLIDNIDDTFTDLDQQVETVTAAVRSEAQSRVDSTFQEALSKQSELQWTVDGFVASLNDQIDDVESQLNDEVNGHVSDLDDLLATQHDAIDATVDDVKADASFRIDAIQSSTRGLVTMLEQQGAADADVQAVLDQSMAALDDVQATTEAQLSTLAQAKADLTADVNGAKADLQSSADATVAQLRGVVDEAVDETHDRLDFALDITMATAEELAESHTDMANAAVDDLEAAAASTKDDILDKALDLNQRALDAVRDAQELVGDVQSEAHTEVSVDLEYIFEVAEDYSTVPLPDREERAEYWNSVHGQVFTNLGGAIRAGDDAVDSLQDLEAVLASNVDQISALV